MTDDVDDNRLEALVERIRDEDARVHALQAPLDELWPAIRSRIEQRKVIALEATAAPAATRATLETPAASASAPRMSRRRALWASAAGLVAAAVIAVAVFTGLRVRRGSADTPAAARGDAQLLIQAADSTRAYEAEARELLNRLELERAMLRPEAVSAIDHDLRIVDSAIAEVNAAIARDPNNPALRQLLAASYRRKVDVLKRVGNAG